MSTGRFPGRLYPRRPSFVQPPQVPRALVIYDPPIINSATPTIVSTNQTSHSIGMYGRVSAGDLLIGVCAVSGTATPAITWPGGWTIINTPATGTTFILSIAYKRSGGGEAGFTIATAQLATSVTRILQVKNAHATSAPEVGAEVVNVGTAPGPSALNPVGWDGEITLWIPVLAIASTSGAVSAYPSGYSPGLPVIAANGVALAYAQRGAVADSADPGPFASSPSASFRVTTIAVRPAPGVARTGNHLMLSA